MEEQIFRANKLKPIISGRMSITNQSDYHTFMKKGCKILSKAMIDKTNSRTSLFGGFDVTVPSRLIKIIKMVKHTRKLDLSKMALSSRSNSFSKMLYFAKKTSQSQIILMNDVKAPEKSSKSLFERWPRYIKRAKTFSYNMIFEGLFFGQRSRPVGPDLYKYTFVRFLRYQPRLKNLNIQFSDCMKSLLKEHWKFERLPLSLEKLSLIAPSFDEPISCSLAHLKNLKHLEVLFNHQSKSGFIASLLETIPQTSLSLQSLSLSWPGHESAHLYPVLEKMKTLNRLNQLKLNLQLSKSDNLENILKPFNDCPISHLGLKISIASEDQLPPIAHLIKKLNKNLVKLKLKVTGQNSFTSVKATEEILRQVDNLLLLKILSVSIFGKPIKNHSFPEVDPILNKIFTKPIPLESFRIRLQPFGFSISKQGFPSLLQKLETLTPSLKKLAIDVGEYRPEKNDFQTILNFLKSVKNIRSLHLQSLSIPIRVIFVEFTDLIYEMPSLQSLALGEIKGNVTKAAFLNLVELILKKRGLKKFDCQVSSTFRASLKKKQKACPDLDLNEIQKINPYLIKTPSLPIFIYNNTFSSRVW